MKNKLNIQNDFGIRDSYNNKIELVSALSQSFISIVGKVFFDELDILISNIVAGDLQDCHKTQTLSICEYFNESEKNKLRISIDNLLIDIKNNINIYKANSDNKFMLKSFFPDGFEVAEDCIEKVEIYKGIICFQINGLESIHDSLDGMSAILLCYNNNCIVVGSGYKYIESREHEYLHYLYKFFGEQFMDKGLSYSDHYVISSLKNEIIAMCAMLDVPYTNQDILMNEVFGDIYRFIEQNINSKMDDIVYLDKYISTLKKEKDISIEEKNRVDSCLFRERMQQKKENMINYAVRYLIDGGDIGGLFVLPPSLRI